MNRTEQQWQDRERQLIEANNAEVENRRKAEVECNAAWVLIHNSAEAIAALQEQIRELERRLEKEARRSV